MLKPPELGIYVSTTYPSLRFAVEDVAFVDDEDGDGEGGFFLVSVVAVDDKDDMSAIGEELDPDEWADFVNEHQLKKIDSQKSD